MSWWIEQLHEFARLELVGAAGLNMLAKPSHWSRCCAVARSVDPAKIPFGPKSFQFLTAAGKECRYRGNSKRSGYFIDPVMTRVVYLAAKLQKPLLLEGPAGSGKTQLAVSVAQATSTPIERLHCYRGVTEVKAIGRLDESLQRLYVRSPLPCPSPKCAMTAEAGGRNVDRMQQPCCMEDGGRPSGGGLQDSPQTAWCCLGVSSQVVNGPGNGERDSSGAGQEGERK